MKNPLFTHPLPPLFRGESSCFLLSQGCLPACSLFPIPVSPLICKSSAFPYQEGVKGCVPFKIPAFICRFNNVQQIQRLNFQNLFWKPDIIIKSPDQPQKETACRKINHSPLHYWFHHKTNQNGCCK